MVNYYNYEYFNVHSLANISCSDLFSLYKRAISGISGSSGLGSDSKEHIDNNIFDMVSAGDQLSFNISKQISPFEFTLQ